MFLKVLRELDYPPIFMIDPKQFEHIEGVSLKGCHGISSTTYPVFAIHRGTKGKVRLSTIYHEVGHLLFPHWKHWQVDLFGEIMARGGGRGYWATKYGKTPADMPPRSHLLKLARRASQRMKRKWQ